MWLNSRCPPEGGRYKTVRDLDRLESNPFGNPPVRDPSCLAGSEFCHYKISVHFPNSRRHQLHQMIVRIAEIKTAASGGPGHFALDPDALCDQALFPGGEILF